MAGIITVEKGGNRVTRYPVHLHHHQILPNSVTDLFLALFFRPFRPDFVLIRQHLRDLNEDFRPLVLGLRFGNVGGVNSVHAQYNFTDRPWVVSQLFKQF